MCLSTRQTVFPPKCNVDQGLQYFDLIIKFKKSKYCKPCSRVIQLDNGARGACGAFGTCFISDLKHNMG